MHKAFFNLNIIPHTSIYLIYKKIFGKAKNLNLSRPHFPICLDAMIRRVHVGAIVAIDQRKRRGRLRGGLILDPWAVFTMPPSPIRSSSGWLGGLLGPRKVLSHMLARAIRMPVSRRARAVLRGHGVVGIPLITQNQHQATLFLAHFYKGW
jgi:hypothetical protein